jgi:hypothetical protein
MVPKCKTSSFPHEFVIIKASIFDTNFKGTHETTLRKVKYVRNLEYEAPVLMENSLGKVYLEDQEGERKTSLRRR